MHQNNLGAVTYNLANAKGLPRRFQLPVGILRQAAPRKLGRFSTAIVLVKNWG